MMDLAYYLTSNPLGKLLSLSNVIVSTLQTETILLVFQSNPVATILPTEVVPNFKPAPAVAYFSSRGPTYGITSLLKVNILIMVFLHTKRFIWLVG